MDFPLLKECAVVFALCVGVLYLCHKVRIPSIVGLLLTGALVGPSGLGLVGSVHEVELMAEIGVALLLFTIGLELSPGELARLKKPVFLGGAAQVGLTIACVLVLGLALGQTGGRATFFGFLAALSSTAIVLRLFQERAVLDSPAGRVVLAILIFQDLVIVPMVLVTPFLAGGTAGPSAGMFLDVAKGAGLVALVYAAGRKLVPGLLERVARVRSREVFLLAVLALCLGVALLTAGLGLSLTLGAFMAGLIISDSEYSLSALEGVLPFKDVFTSLFFISVGMLLNVASFAANLPLVLPLTLGALALKAVLGSVAALLLGYPVRPAIIVGLSLCQIGEFSFVLAKSGVNHGLLDDGTYQLFLSASILTMGLTPLLTGLAPRWADRIVARLPASCLAKRPLDLEMESASSGHGRLSDHLIIVGFGLGGQNLARAARQADIPYVIVEMNPDTVRTASARGEPIFFGDASREAILSHAGVERARVMAVVISDPSAVRGATHAARRLSPSLAIIVRTRFMSEIEPLEELGADEVVPEEFETSIEIFARALRRYLIPEQDIEAFSSAVRAESYGLFRSLAGPERPETAASPDALLSGRFTDMDVVGLAVAPTSVFAGRTLEETRLRKDHGLTLVAVRRGGETLANPEPTLRLLAGDVAYVFGEHAAIAAKAGLFTGRKTS